MRDFDEFESGDGGTVFRDVIMLALLGFMTLVVMLLPHLNPPTRAAGSVDPPGNVIVEVRWPDGHDTDIDLWVEAGGERPVGYSNKSGRYFNLLRDDLGLTSDPTGLNYEVAYSRGVAKGAYTVNLHAYSDKSGSLPVPVAVSVSIKRDGEKSPEVLVGKDVELRRIGEELTVVRFDLDENGHVVPGSVHDLPKGLRSQAGDSATRR